MADEVTGAIWDTTRAYTMLSRENILAIVNEMERLHAEGIPGAVVECGVGNGGGAMAMALALTWLQDFRPLYLYDLWSSMPQPEIIDGELARRMWEPDICRSAFEKALEALHATDYPMELLCWVRGDMLETIPGQAPDRIAFLHLDADWHRATAHCLKHLGARLSPGAAILVDDYYEWEGCQRAVDAYIASGGVFDTRQIDRSALLLRRL